MIEQVKPTEYDTILNECRIKIGGTVDKFVPNINASKWNDDNIVMPEETLSWVIWVTDRADYTAELAEVTEQEYLIDITSYDFQVIVGVQAKIVSGEEVYLSEITWSDSGDVELVPILFALLQDVLAPKGVRRQ